MSPIADTSLLFNLLGTDNTGAAVDSAVAHLGELDVATAESNVKAASGATMSASAQKKANDQALADWKAQSAEMAAAEDAAYKEDATRAKAAAGEKTEASKSGGSGMGGLVELAGIAAVGEGLKSSVEAAETANKTYAQTAAVLASTGDAAGLTETQIQSMSNTMGLSAGVSGVAVQQATNLELRNTTLQKSIGNGTISAAQLTQTTLDLAASMSKGGSTADTMNVAAAALGKALGNPFAPTKALTAAGITLTQQQTEQLKAFKATNDVADAQKLVLDALSKSTAGQADANATAGAKLKAQLSDLEVTIGEKVLPVIETMTEDMMKVINFIEAHSTVFGLLATVLGTVAGAILLVVGATKAWAVAGEILDVVLEANPIGIVIVAIAALAAGLIYAYDHFTTFRNGVNDVWGVMETVFGWIKSNWPLLLGIILGPFALAAIEILTHLGAIKSAVTGFFGTAVTWLEHAGEMIVQGLINGIGNLAGGLLSKVQSLAGDVTGAFSKVLGIFSPSRVFTEHGANIVAGLVNGITTNTPAAKAAATALATATNQSASGTLSVGSKSVANTQPPIVIQFSGSGADLALLQVLRNNIRIRGGNVQTVLGGAN